MFKVDAFTFFDRRSVESAVDRAKRRNLSKAGAYVRRRARSSIRKRKGISNPGDPPSSHAGTLKRLIFFGYDRSSESVFVGPLQFRSRQGLGGASRLEFGGNVRRKGRMLRYQARPFMRPALEAEASNFPDLWRNSVR